MKTTSLWRLFSILLILPILIGIDSCREDLSKTTLGPAISTEEKNNLILNALGILDLNDIKKGDWVKVGYSQRTALAPPFITGLTTKQVYSAKKEIEENETGTDEFFVLKTIFTEYGNDQKTILNKFLHELRLPLSEDVATQKSSEKEVNEIQDWLLSKGVKPFSINYLPCDHITPINIANQLGITVHELAASKYKISKSSLGNPEACSTSTCNIGITDISYIEVFPTQEGSERFHCSFKITQDAPFFAQDIQKCIGFLASLEDRDISARICQDVVDFEFGSE